MNWFFDQDFLNCIDLNDLPLSRKLKKVDIGYRYNYFTGRVDKSQSFEITGASIGLAKRLRIPDDYFTLSQSLAYQYYNLNNYYTGLFPFGDGSSNNLSYTVALSRNNTFTNPIFPLGGSEFVLLEQMDSRAARWEQAMRNFRIFDITPA